MLDYEWRVRDLVHGTIMFTKDERKFIETPLFERLRGVGQTDLSNAICPSMNTTRYEHLLGACHIAGRMAESITHSVEWNAYKRDLVTAHTTTFRLNTEEMFVKVARFYALLHDIGHFPLSHLFEDAFDRYAGSIGKKSEDLVAEWFGIKGYQKPHEAFGAYLMPRLKPVLPDELFGPLNDLMTKKELRKADPLNVIKKIVDSEVDADRIDYVKRDGLMAGGEYGAYDINRLCTSVAVVKVSTAEGDEWDIAFEDRAITSIESLLFDRYRIYTWFHFHHRAVMIKACAARLIEKALHDELIKQNHFKGLDEDIALRDDAWLKSVLRKVKSRGDPHVQMMQDAVSHYTRKHIASVWKRRPRYHRFQKVMRTEVERNLGHSVTAEQLEIKDVRGYEEHLTEWIGKPVLCTVFRFKPLSGKDPIRLYAASNGALRKETALQNSTLLQTLTYIWKKGDIQYMVHIVEADLGDALAEKTKRDEVCQEWAEVSALYQSERLSNVKKS